MKRIALLKTLTVILFVICIVTMFFTVPFILVLAVMPGQIPFKINGHAADTLGIETILCMLAAVVGFAFFIYALHLFKKTLELFEKKKMFHADVVKYLDQTGKAILIGYTITAATTFIYNTLVENNLELNVALGFDSSFFIVGLGLFFLVLSDVFLMAKNIKDENDLTL
ncbi:DUF2975 domain-containing protein [Flavobacterium sp. Sd200]|uniref:DUF2975 domain-containing protein n=1 Tax=Flavobacterium sp. Sd200 TaxID=2692211 RepID=UPI00136D4F67|nr:DUF2975 domain-containing protein [Flavobacterium sp. Sd200]MXN92783.1 DUF2975 domain-containing protein [Flavobacterium sp. Sd200]